MRSDDTHSPLPAPGLWPHIRAAFIAFHLVAIGADGIPSTSAALSRATWKDPTVQAEMDAWGDRLGVEPDLLEDHLFEFAGRWARARKLLLRPFSTYIQVTATNQPWQMFVAPHVFPTRLQLAVSTDGNTWTTVFEERSTTANWMAPLFGTERMRSTVFRWGWPPYRSAYHKGCTALARQLFLEEPTTSRVRCQFIRVRSPSPAEAAADVEPHQTIVTPFEVRR